MEQLPDISVIIPVYKAEKYLNKCIDSFLNQDYKNFELILIDDGSPDDSGSICDAYAQKDNRIKVIHKENEGVSIARQTGLEASKGKYTIHADPDDWVDNNMLSSLYNQAINNNADVVICDMWVDYDNGTRQLKKQKPTGLKNTDILNDLFGHLHGSMCNKLIKRECFIKYKISFPKEISFCEDLLVCIRLFKNPIRILYLEKAFYHYEQNVNSNSIVRKSSLKQIQEDKILFDLINKELNEYPNAPKNYKSVVAANLLERGFMGNVLNNQTFISELGIYKKYIEKMPIKRMRKILYKLSFMGFYSTAIKIYHAKKHLR